MMARQEITKHNGDVIEEIVIKGNRLTATFLTWGATLKDLRFEGCAHPLVLGYEAFEQYVAHSQYFGCTAGRYANRIAEGQCSIDGADVQLDRNEGERHHLHGGHIGIPHRNWTVEGLGETFVEFSILDSDGQSGYPGNCYIRARFELTDDDALHVIYTCETDKPTIANIAHHSYFNLDGSKDILSHQFQILADHYIPVRDDLIPTGEIKSVAGTDFDFRHMRDLVSSSGFTNFDHNFCLLNARTDMRLVARVFAPKTGLSMDVISSEPGIQFYAGGSIQDFGCGLSGQVLGPYSGFCLETQVWPDSPNHSDFPSALLKPGETLRQETKYRFSKK